MTRFVVLLKFTEKGISAVKDSPARAEAFRKLATGAGVNVEAQYWTLGEYDGAMVLSAADEATIVAAILALGKEGNVRTTMLRAYDAGEMTSIIGKLPAGKKK
jgi:uncharacterized protein with GYD domain